MITRAREILWQLYAIPIETLALSERTLQFLKWDGITSLEDCVVFFYREAHQQSRTLPVTTRLMYHEVEPNMKAQGYWSYVLDAEIWDALKDPTIHPLKRKVALWEGEERDLYEINLGQLNLSDEDLLHLKWYVYRTLGQAVDFCLETIKWHSVAFYRRDRDDIHNTARMAFQLLLPILETLGYWPLIEENIDSQAFLEVGW